jgi:hypothetical protein
MARIALSHRLPANLGALLALALFVLGPGGCNGTGNGSLTLVIDQTALALDPLADARVPQVTRLALYDDDTGSGLGEVPLQVGERTRLTAVAPGTRNLRLEGLSPTNQVLAAARAFDVDLATGRSQEVPLHLRKPLVYVGGGPQIQVTDSSASSLGTGAVSAIQLGGIDAMTTTRAGDLLVAALGGSTGYSLVWIDTASHAERGRIPLSGPVRSMVVHHHDQFIVALQTLNDTVILVDVAALVAGTNVDAAFHPVSVSRPLGATFDENDNLWVISANPATCSTPLAPPGQLLHLDRSGNQLEAPVALPALGSDVGLNPVSGRPLVTLGCAGKVVELQGSTFADVAAVQGLGDAAIDGSTLYAVGWQPATESGGLSGVVSVLDLQQGAGSRQVVFPIKPQALSLGETDSHGNAKFMYISAVSLAPRAVSVTSQGGRVAFLHTVNYNLVTDMHDQATGLTLCKELVISLIEQGVTLVDLETGQIVWTKPTTYDNACTCDRSPYGPNGVCIQGLNEALDGPAYTPTSLTILTGSR